MTTQPHRNVWLTYVLPVLAVVAVIIAIVVSMNPRTAKPAASQQAVQSEDHRLANPDKTFAIVVDEQKLVSGPSEMMVKRGDSVRVNLTAVKEEAKLRLEGYDIITESHPTDDTPGGFSFIADKTGTFAFYAIPETESEGEAAPAERKLGTITVK